MQDRPVGTCRAWTSPLYRGTCASCAKARCPRVTAPDPAKSGSQFLRCILLSSCGTDVSRTVRLYPCNMLYTFWRCLAMSLSVNRRNLRVWGKEVYHPLGCHMGISEHDFRQGRSLDRCLLVIGRCSPETTRTSRNQTYSTLIPCLTKSMRSRTTLLGSHSSLRSSTGLSDTIGRRIGLK